MDLNSTKELGFPDYWNKRYGKGAGSEQATHEWFRTFEKLRLFLEKELPNARSEPRILHLGCGDSVRIRKRGDGSPLLVVSISSRHC